MKAAVLYEYGKPLVIEEVDLQDPQEKEVRIRIMATGVCHSDLHAQKGELPVPMPMVLGHEAAGVIESVGKGVTSLEDGDHVVLSVVAPCGHCKYCAVGKQNLCDVNTEEIYAGGVRGGKPRLSKNGKPIYHKSGIASYAEYAVVREEGAIKIDSDIPFTSAALAGCAVMTGVGSAINTAQVEPGSTVMVIGCGGVGLNIMQGAALAGAKTILAVDIVDDKLEFAKQFGATHILNAKDVNPAEVAKDLTGGAGVDYAFDATGNPKAILQALDAIKRGGTLLMVGLPPLGVEVPLPGIMMIIDAKRIIGCVYGSSQPRLDFPRIFDFYKAKKLKLDELVSGILPLSEVNEAFARLERGEVIRTVLLPHG
jgi:S-(hydroxymethyl)glutathione dehydrogenase/alcohol dehydrogenase